MGISWSKLAEHTLIETIGYVRNMFNTSIATRVNEEILSSVDILASMPRLGVRDSRWNGFGEIRKLVCKQNNIYYLLKEDKIIVIIVWNSRRNPKLLDMLIRQYLTDKIM